jgi:hypothetical protein
VAGLCQGQEHGAGPADLEHRDLGREGRLRPVQAGRSHRDQEPYTPGEGGDDSLEMLVCTFADPDGNYFQLLSPMTD